MRSIAVLFVAVLTVSAAASCTGPPSMHPAIADWWANGLATLAGNRPPKPFGLALSSWRSRNCEEIAAETPSPGQHWPERDGCIGDYTIAWRRGPAFLSKPRADRWEVRIARGGWTAAPVTDVPGGVLSTYLDGTPPVEGTRVSVRGVNAAGTGPATSIRIAIPQPQMQRSVPSPGGLRRRRALAIAAARARRPPCQRPPPGVPSTSLSPPASGARDR